MAVGFIGAGREKVEPLKSAAPANQRGL